MDPTQRERWDEAMAAADSPALRIELLRAFVRDFPDHGPAWHTLGRELTDVAKFDEAEQALHRAAGLIQGPRHFLFCSFGRLFRYKGEPDVAEGWFRKATDEAPDDSMPYIYLGSILAAQGQLAEAEQVHRRGAACKECRVDEAWHNLGLVLRAQGRYDEALACFETALKLDPQYKAARLAARDVRRAMAVLTANADPAAEAAFSRTEGKRQLE